MMLELQMCSNVDFLQTKWKRNDTGFSSFVENYKESH